MAFVRRSPSGSLLPAADFSLKLGHNFGLIELLHAASGERGRVPGSVSTPLERGRLAGSRRLRNVCGAATAFHLRVEASSCSFTCTRLRLARKTTGSGLDPWERLPLPRAARQTKRCCGSKSDICHCGSSEMREMDLPGVASASFSSSSMVAFADMKPGVPCPSSRLPRRVDAEPLSWSVRKRAVNAGGQNFGPSNFDRLRQTPPSPGRTRGARIELCSLLSEGGASIWDLRLTNDFSRQQ